MSTAHRTLLIATVLVLLVATPVTAGTISIAWDPVTDADLLGYRVYSGTASHTYSQSTDVGNVTAATITATDCQLRYVAVKAYDAAGNESMTYSNEISGWPRPTLTTVTPNAAEAGRTLTVTVTGTNFQTGATLSFSNPGITVSSVAVNSCTQITATIAIAGGANIGLANLEVRNPDQVFGAGTGLFTVQIVAPPQVSATSPADGATSALVTVKPTVTFSEPMLAASIIAANIRVLAMPSGNVVAQAAGSPTLSANGLTATITPAASLINGTTYKIQVTTGVRDAANTPMDADFTQANGFLVGSDITPPTISAVDAPSVASTTATITWTTNENSDSQVFYRRLGDTADQVSPINATLTTSHSVTVQGLQPATQYTYTVRSADSGNNAATSSPAESFTTNESSYSYLRVEAENGTLVAPVRTQTGTGAFSGSYIDTPSGTATGSATSPAGSATFGVNLPIAGTWYLWVRMYAPSPSSDSWFESINGATRQMIFPTSNAAWVWAAGRNYNLNAGVASVELAGREALTRADRILLTNDPTFVPTEQGIGDVTPPAGVTTFTATPGNLQVALSWNNPTTNDYQRTVIRYRTDGIYPRSPVDGILVADRPAGPGSSDSFIHGGLTAATSYKYSAFAIDAMGNYAPAAQVTMVPIEGDPPPTVGGVRRTDTAN